MKGTTHLDCISKVEQRKGVEAGFPVGTNMGEETQNFVSVEHFDASPLTMKRGKNCDCKGVKDT